jgi:sulfatase modifying factor 1
MSDYLPYHARPNRMNARSFVIIVAVLSVLTSGIAAPSSTSFTYQGRLAESGAPADGNYDFQFNLFGTEAGGAALTIGLTNTSVPVSNGVFTALLDFGIVPSANTTWIEIAVRRAGQAVPFTTLNPRQPLTPVPYSIHTLRAESLVGPLPESQLPTNVARLTGNQIFTANIDVQGTLRAGTFTGDGTALSNVAASALSARLAQRLWRVFIPFVAITNAGNTPDTTGKGAVPYAFRIGKFEISNHQYTTFLNAIAADDAHMVYVTNMTTDVNGGIVRSGVPGEYIYTVKPGFEHLPAVWVTFFSAVRFCNWLHHGQPSGVQDASTTEDGAYAITATAELANTIARNPQARFWLPSDDEWYKAAYHHPAAVGGPSGDYWQFPTRSDEVPFSELPPGGSNSANACCETGRQGTPVGAYRNATSYYGAYDLAGNVQEWTEEIIFVTNRRLRGGSFIYNELYSQSADFEFDTPDYTDSAIGFRVAGPLEP